MTTTSQGNAGVLSTIKVDASALTWFATILKGWPKQAGSKPSDAMLTVPLLLGKRAGVEALHVAMTLRPEGCTVAQFCLAGSCGPANNYRRALVKAGWFSGTVVGKPYAYVLTVTKKGADKLAKAQAAIDAAAQVQPVKAKVTRKAKRAAKAKATPTVTVTVQPATPVAVAPTPASDAPSATAKAMLGILAEHTNTTDHTD